MIHDAMLLGIGRFRYPLENFGHREFGKLMLLVCSVRLQLCLLLAQDFADDIDHGVFRALHYSKTRKMLP